MYNHRLYILFWMISALALVLGNIFFPGYYVLGNARLSAVESSIYASFWITFIYWVFWDFAVARAIPNSWEGGSLLYYLIANTISLWVVARFALYVGFGIPSYLTALFLSVFLTAFQKAVWSIFIKSQNPQI